MIHSLLVFWGLFACEPAPEPFMDLVDVYQPTLTVNYSERREQGPKLQVLLNPARAGVCRPLPELKGDVDGVPLTRLHGNFQDENFQYNRDCNVYEFEADAAVLGKRAEAPDAVVTLTDGKTSYSVKVKNLFVPRTLRVEGALVAGQEGVFRIEPPGDIVGDKPVFQLLFAAGETKTKVEAPWIDGGIHAVVPADIHGEATVEWFGTGFVQPSLEACTATLCTASRTVVAAPFMVSVK